MPENKSSKIRFLKLFIVLAAVTALTAFSVKAGCAAVLYAKATASAAQKTKPLQAAGLCRM
jgi:hypothetical protein